MQKLSPESSFGLLAVLFSAAFLLAALYPYRWGLPTWVDNQVDRSVSGGLSFPEAGVAWTLEPPSWIAEAKRTNKLKIFLNVTPFSLHQGGPARILTVSQDKYHRNLTIAQERAALVVRLRTPQTSKNGVPPHVVPDFFSVGESRQFCVSIVPGRIDINSAEKTVLVADLPSETLSVWDAGYRLAVGNELTWDRPWMGAVEQAVLETETTRIDYLRPDRLVIPDGYWTSPNWSWLPVQPVDPAINFLLFIPLGYLAAKSCSYRPSIRRAVVWCGGLSLLAESAQLLLPARFPSTSDLVMNCCGAAVGGWLARRQASRRG